MAKKTKKAAKATTAPRARRGAPSRKKGQEADQPSPDPDPAPTGEPGSPPGKPKVTGITLGLGDDGEADTSEATQTSGPRRRRKRTGRISSPATEVPADPDPVPTAEIEKAKEGKHRKKDAEPPKRFSNRPSQPSEPDMSVQRLAAAYLDHLRLAGKSMATQFSYSMDLGIAKRELGAETLIADLTPERVAAFFESPAVTTRKNGRPKTQVTIDKTRRVLRMALTWAEEEGRIAEAPLPTTAATEKE
jgi:hypothetical protein